MFTIRTYFYDFDSLEQHEKIALSEALSSMSPAALAYKGLTDKIELLKKDFYNLIFLLIYSPNSATAQLP